MFCPVADATRHKNHCSCKQTLSHRAAVSDPEGVEVDHGLPLPDPEVEAFRLGLFRAEEEADQNVATAENININERVEKWSSHPP
jgi:hypothetical protein